MSLKSKTFRAAAMLFTVTAMTAFSADWPNFHGPNRTNKSTETGLLKSWPADGPRLLWTASGMGEGYSGVSTSGGIIYTAGVKNQINHVIAIDRRNGKTLWEKPAGPAWEAERAFARAYQGTRSTPTISDGMLYYLSNSGVLVALDAKTGDQKWSINIREKYEAVMPGYGYSESPLVIGERLYVAPYGKRVSVICLNKKTGETIWESRLIHRTSSGDYAGYVSFVPIDNSGYKQIVGITNLHLYGMDIENGNVLWTVPFKNDRDNNCTDIVYHDGVVLAATGYRRGTTAVRLSKKDGGGVKVERLFDSMLMDNHHGGLILHNGFVYGSGHESPGWFCVEHKTGKTHWNQEPGKGSITFADGMLYLYDESGKMSLVRATPEAFREVSSFNVPSGGKGAHWAHPVISHGVLYLRHADNLYAYAVK